MVARSGCCFPSLIRYGSEGCFDQRIPGTTCRPWNHRDLRFAVSSVGMFRTGAGHASGAKSAFVCVIAWTRSGQVDLVAAVRNSCAAWKWLFLAISTGIGRLRVNLNTEIGDADSEMCELGDADSDADSRNRSPPSQRPRGAPGQCQGDSRRRRPATALGRPNPPASSAVRVEGQVHANLLSHRVLAPLAFMLA